MHLEKEGVPYNKQSAELWIQDTSPGLHRTTESAYRRALCRLDSAYHHEEIDNVKAWHRGVRQSCLRLIPWCRNVLDAFLEEISAKYGASYLRFIRIAVVRFLNYSSSWGCHETKDITHRLVSDYFCYDEHSSYVARGAYINCVRKFLCYLSDKGIIQSSISVAFDKIVQERLFFVEELSSDELAVLRASSDSSFFSSQEFYQKSLEMDKIIKQYKYAKTAVNVSNKALKELFIFLEANSLNYSLDIALAWATHMRHYSTQWKSFRRALMIFDIFRVTGQINPQKRYLYKPDRVDSLPMWCKAVYKEFIGLKEKEGYTESTVTMYRNSCLRLLKYLCDNGISSWSSVTPETLKEFHRQDSHSTPEGSNAYSYKIRKFLEHLGEIGHVPPALFMALPSESAPRVDIIRTLADDEIAKIHNFQNSTDDALSLRGIAMIILGLRMGIRASDIVKIKFSDISWEYRTISILQQKTRKFLKLPMPVEVGNALYRYIMQARPNVSSEYIFITHKAPYSRLNRGACLMAFRKVLSNQAGGFRVVRKTFASKMLVNDVEVSRIAEALGHVDNSSVMTYLSTNDEKMRLCALSLAEIPVKGGFLYE
jgi:site-specific recombinase XerD